MKPLEKWTMSEWKIYVFHVAMFFLAQYIDDISTSLKINESANTRSLSGVPDYFYRNKISSGGDLSHYSSASLY